MNWTAFLIWLAYGVVSMQVGAWLYQRASDALEDEEAWDSPWPMDGEPGFMPNTLMRRIDPATGTSITYRNYGTAHHCAFRPDGYDDLEGAITMAKAHNKVNPCQGVTYGGSGMVKIPAHTPARRPRYVCVNCENEGSLPSGNKIVLEDCVCPFCGGDGTLTEHERTH